MSEYINLVTDAGTFRAYIARPANHPAPAVVVLHEVFGVNADLRLTCEALAASGFIAICPDLYWRQSPGVDLDVTSENDWNTGLSLNRGYDREAGVVDVMETIKVAVKLSGASGKVAVMGYCIGGLMTFLTAAQVEVNAAIAFHGGDTEKYLDRAPGITSPMLMHLAGDDEFIPPSAQAEIKAALAGKPNVHIFDYPFCRHAFSRHGGAHYNVEAAKLANQRTRDFLYKYLY